MPRILPFLLILSLTLTNCGGASDDAKETDKTAKTPAAAGTEPTETATDLVTLSAAEQRAAALRTGHIETRQ
ncbi:MAG TPA: hypothetical protein VK364_02885, partial [Hymenobacter sp.]|nr:hypothetical protein [Hymenobacter sp.]